MRGGWLIGAALGLAQVAACIGAGAFECQSDLECVDGDVIGLCQPGGFCSFPDADCASGQRYGEKSGSMSGECVPIDPGTSSGPSTTASQTASAGTATSTSMSTTSSTGPQLTSGPTSTVGTTATGDSNPSSSSSESTGSNVDPDLVLWLKLDDDFDTTVAEDTSQHAHDGSCNGAACPNSTPGPVDSAAQFDGVDDFISVPSAPQFDSLESVTITAWIYPDVEPVGQRSLVTKPLDSGVYNTWEVYFFDGLEGVIFSMGAGLADITISSPGPFPVGDWTHVSATWDGEEMGLWLDGVPVASAANNEFIDADTPVLVGADQDLGIIEGFFEGAIDDVRVYSRALTQSEIEEIVAGGGL